MSDSYAEQLDVTLRALVTELHCSDDELLVVSAAAAASDSGWSLIYGSAIVGPAEMGRVPWFRWHAEDTRLRDTFGPLLSYSDTVPTDWVNFERTVGAWKFLRYAISTSELPQLLASVVLDGHLPSPFGLSITAEAGPTNGLVRLFQHQARSAGPLAAMAGRPMLAWTHRLETPAAKGNLPQDWPDGQGLVLPGALLWLTGLSTALTTGPDAPRMVFGRLERRAWLGALRGRTPDLSAFQVSIRLDPTRVSLRELVLDLEETDTEGNLLFAIRCDLADLDVPAHGVDEHVAELPTLGSMVTRRVRLYDISGTLLDAADDVRLIEKVSVTVHVAGKERDSTTSVGPGLPVPTATTRLGRLKAAEAEWERLVAAGMSNRVIATRAAGSDVVRKHIAAARSELMVFDPYFGAKSRDWSVLADVKVPVRILTASTSRPPADSAPNAPKIEVKQWVGGGRPPFHDRAYLWEGGGLVVGTSPSGLGRRMAMVDTLDSRLSRELQRMFKTWWSDSRFV